MPSCVNAFGMWIRLRMLYLLRTSGTWPDWTGWDWTGWDRVGWGRQVGVVWACFSHLPDPDGKTQIIRCIESLLFLIPWYILNRIECWIPLSILNLYFHLEGVYFFPSCLVLLLCYILRSHCSDFWDGRPVEDYPWVLLLHLISLKFVEHTDSSTVKKKNTVLGICSHGLFIVCSTAQRS